MLTFTSAEKNFGLTSACTPFATLINNWEVSEILKRHPHPDLREKGVGVYKLQLKRSVSTQQDVWRSLDGARELAKELDVAWCYAWGKPYYSITERWVSSEAPDGWSGNLREVEADIQRKSCSAFVAASQIVDRRWEWWPTLPLKNTVTARQATATAPAIIRELIELHIRAHKARDAKLFLLAKALEIVGAFFAGTPRRQARNSGIEQEMKTVGVDGSLTKSVEWLFNIANERFDVRHAWDPDSPGVVLHPRMMNQEQEDFIFNSDLIIRSFICERLGIPVPLITRYTGDPKDVGYWKGDVLEFGA